MDDAPSSLGTSIFTKVTKSFSALFLGLEDYRHLI